MTEITSLSLFELIKNIKEKKISSNEAAKSFINRSQKSKKLNAYVTGLPGAPSIDLGLLSLILSMGAIH